MSDIKISCPQCQQHIQCDEGYCGMEITCPTCHASMVVPRISTVPAVPPAPPAPAGPASIACPGCGVSLAPRAIMCVQCGFNLRTGQPTRTASGKPMGKHSVAAAVGASKWYATPYPYIGFVAVVLAALYFLGLSNPVFKLGFAVLALLYLVACHITVLVFAFKDSVVKGFLCLCIGIYAVYWVYVESENSFLKAAYGVNLLITLAIYTMKE